MAVFAGMAVVSATRTTPENLSPVAVVSSQSRAQLCRRPGLPAGGALAGANKSDVRETLRT